jgi:hypothetical protein
LLLDFAGAQTLDPRITFTRASSATRFDSTGTLVTMGNNEARFDYNPTTLAPLGLLIEEQRTNLVTYSEQFDNAAWTKTRSSITANATTSPDGTVDADKLVEDTTATSTHLITQSFSGTTGTIYTATLYAKAAGRDFVRISLPSAIFGVATTWAFNLTTGATTPIASSSGTTATSENVGNGWWRIRVTSIAATATASGNFQVAISETATNATYTGDGTSGLYIWGAQLEAGAFPTSYIHTVASQVTRSADVAVMTGTNFSDWYNAAEGTLFAEGSFGRAAGIFGVDDTTNNNRMRIGHTGTTATNYTSVVSGAVQFSTNSSPNTLPLNTVGKMAMAYQINNYQGTLNSASVFTNTSSLVPAVSQATIGAAQASNTINGHIRKITYYPRRLANSELQAITA